MKTVTITLTLVLMTWTMAMAAPLVDLDRIANIESSGCRNITGRGGRSIGCHQLEHLALDDVNRATGRTIKLEQLKDIQLSYWAADQYINGIIPKYLRSYKMADTVENRIIAYNWGIGNLVRWNREGRRYDRLPVITRSYLKKYSDDNWNREFNR